MMAIDRALAIEYSDSHVHLHAYPDAEVHRLLHRAAMADVGLLGAVSVDLASARRTVAIAAAHPRSPRVVAAVGFHPVYLRAVPSETDLRLLEVLAADPSVGFIGEIGLDSVEASLPFSEQIAALRAQLALVGRVGKPVNLHLRGAIEPALTILDQEGTAAIGAVFHYFVGGEDLALRALDRGLYLSIGKPVTRPENGALRAAVRQIPLRRLLLETDTYPLPDRVTEPADVRRVAQAVAELKGIPVETVAAVTTANLRGLLSRKTA